MTATRLTPRITFLRTNWLPKNSPSRPVCYSTAAPTDVSALLSKPTWSVKSLLPVSQQDRDASITPKQLRHLLRLAALPQPSTQVEEEDMLKTLASQIHFVKEIQQVDTTNVSPLRSIRDETGDAQKENTIDLALLKSALEREEFVGRAKRIRRKHAEKLDKPDGDTWDGDALKAASKTMGRYFVVQSGSD
ncbi:uncharacterized protein GIQ15_05853 [Arthroderma uncinatum]|uniref:uncharacterized protein n=1 Tax=Arthroderma uncinatum TaxID=74035 RepID=UPI00144AE204|nr:uncharacterized protein GIQ15_05853 [Arthroderma uncinatum]KAF3480506.1 hypothetical protein GIQ15_05853 [Arthroderma uncinatum]